MSIYVFIQQVNFGYTLVSPIIKLSPINLTTIYEYKEEYKGEIVIYRIYLLYIEDRLMS